MSLTVNAFDDEDRCIGCHLEFDVGEKILDAMDKSWHHHCFRCYNCAKEFTDRDAEGDLEFAIHKCKDGIDRPMHPKCSQSYLDQQAKVTKRGGWAKETTFNNKIADECMNCGKEVKGNAKRVPWKGKMLIFHLTCFKCAKCGEGMRDNDRFHDGGDRPICQKCGGSYKPVS